MQLNVMPLSELLTTANNYATSIKELGIYSDLVKELCIRLDAGSIARREITKQRDALVAENIFLMNMAARELSTSWMFHKTMLGAQAALVCVAQGDITSARDWLEGTTDEAGAELPDDITVAGLEDWFNAQMVSNDDKTGFLTRDEADKAIRAETPATDAFLREVRVQGVEMFAEQQRSFIGNPSKNDAASSYSSREAIKYAEQLRKGAAS